VTGTLTAATRKLLARTSTATLATQMMKRGLRNAFLRGVHRLTPGAAPMIGLAWTLRYIPAREDLATLESLGNPEHPQRQGIETIPKGHVLVMDCRGETDAAAIGAILIARLKARDAAGFVADGGIRDLETAAQQGLPLFAAGAAAPANVTRHHAVALNQPIGCGGVPVFPGDVVVGDGDGVVVLPAQIAHEIAVAAVEQEQVEDFLLKEIRGGRSLFGTYPPNDETMRRYRTKAKRKPKRR
jgi:regulator of RNase E activity RraA